MGRTEMVKGNTPPVAVGGGTWIDTGAPVVDWPRTLAGQVSVSGGMSGRVGAVGVSSPHAGHRPQRHGQGQRQPAAEAGSEPGGR